MANSPSSKPLPKGIWTLSFSSLFNDIASDAAYPLLPIFLSSTLGASAFSLGLIEGLAESVASLLKFFSGTWSDRLPKKKGMVIFGYGMSSLLKPFIGLCQTWPQVLFIRFFDRVGKGIRSAPRDAWLSKFTTRSEYPRVYGFHRGMDHTGAFLGPMLAGIYLFYFPGEYRSLFLLTLIPGIIAMLLIGITQEKPSLPTHEKDSPPLNLIMVWKELDPNLRRYFVILSLFAIGNSTDAFLILRLRQAEISDGWIPILWAALHLVRLMSSFASYHVVRKIGEKNSIMLGWGVFTLSYFSFAWLTDAHYLILIFLFYGLFSGLTEGPERSLVAKFSKESKKGAAFGMYAMTLGIAPLPASLAFGFLSSSLGYSFAFAVGGTFAFAAMAALFCFKMDILTTNTSTTI